MCCKHLQQQIERNVCLQCTLQRSKKGRVAKSRDFPYLTRQRHALLEQLNRSSPNNTCPGSGAWHQTLGKHSSTPEILINSSSSTHQDYYPDIKYFPSIQDNLFRLQASSKLRGLMYYPWPTKYTWHPTWYSKTRVNPLRQPWNRSTNSITDRLYLTY